MSSTSEIIVRYAETDAMGIVHHATYPIWFEVARTDYIKQLGISYSELERSGVMLPVTEITCHYHQPARYEDVLDVTARISRLTPARIEFSYAVTRRCDGTLLCEGTSSHGFVDAHTFRPVNFRKTRPDLYSGMKREHDADYPAEAE